ncbi:hypothetical protein [Paenibacillus sp. 32O-W]|uniref:hypothetical protein n=1 Tax=Paenibacillus sp. 32O-W TaxID=1695218 RepID=UPI00119ED100|nr:hypothetical protein [Paenibacillus sp. 32O-W]
MTLEEIGVLFDRIVECYPQFTGDLAKMKTWHAVLKNIPFDTAMDNLLRYASNPENQYPPHPGALALDRQTDVDRFHEYLHDTGKSEIIAHEHRMMTGVPPTPEQSRKVRDILAKHRNPTV